MRYAEKRTRMISTLIGITIRRKSRNRSYGY